MSSGLLLFVATYFMAAVTPGPGVAAVVARVLAKGTSGTPSFVAGIIVGDLLWFGIAAAGLTVLAQTFAMLFLAIKYAGAAYLLFMAWKLWTAPVMSIAPAQVEPDDRKGRLFAAGLALTLSNPKAMVFTLAVLPTVVSLENLSLAGFIEIAGLIVLIVSVVFSAYTLAAARARQLFTSQRSIRRLNRGTGIVMAGAAVAVATR
jgi:threonine/homoserine/homoserine lactone efflux protein